jgi:hypothetical protein
MVIGGETPEWCGPPPHGNDLQYLADALSIQPGAFGNPRRSAHHCATSVGTVQVPPARYATPASDRHCP